MKSSGTLRSRFPSAPTTPLTNRKIDSYILAGRYGEDLKQRLLAKQSTKPSRKKRPSSTPTELFKNSMALKGLT